MGKNVEPRKFIGRLCEHLVQVLIQRGTGYNVANHNDSRVNHPVTDLDVENPSTGTRYHVSVKASCSKEWPSVSGIQEPNQYIVFVHVSDRANPEFYVLSFRQWSALLKKLLPSRDQTASIVNGSIVFNWDTPAGVKQKKRGLIRLEELSRFKSKWSILPGWKEA